MIELYEYLSKHKEDCPEWLNKIEPIKPVFNKIDFFNSRIVFYPGSGVDGHPIKLFGSSHSAHCFIYSDYMAEKDQITAVLDGDGVGYTSPVLGYHSLLRIDLKMEDLTSDGWRSHLDRPINFRPPSIKPYGFVEILERNADLDDDHGAKRLAILFLGSDGHATYDALFCQNNGVLPPFCLFIQDHGFGGNYSDFGHGGLMHQIALKTRVLPDWLIVSTNSSPWEGYQVVPDVNGDLGGMHMDMRKLYRKV
jgi:hypothetical protein